MQYICTTCGKPYPVSGTPFRCPACGGLFDALTWELGAEDPGAPGIWRWGASFGLDAGAGAVSLGEGNTPLVRTEFQGRHFALKVEGQNPSGSYKDRGASVLAAFLRSRGVTQAVEDSSGNAGASFAAYAARAGIRARIFVPAATSGPKKQQIETYGAELVRIPGTRQDTADAVLRAAEAGAPYASHAAMPFVLPGYATIAYEIVEQLGCVPGAVVTPVGAGGLLLGMWRGFRALQRAGRVDRLPRLAGIQAARCAPFLSEDGSLGENTETVAEGVRVFKPVRRAAVLDAVKESGGFLYAVEEEKILPARDHLARLGFYVEPTSALVLAALESIGSQLPEPLVLVLTGSGLKCTAAPAPV